jgi:hypothetical protein
VGERRYNSNVLQIDTVWRRAVSFTPRPLYPQGKISVPIGCVGDRVCLEVVRKRKILHLQEKKTVVKNLVHCYTG